MLFHRRGLLWLGSANVTLRYLVRGYFLSKEKELNYRLQSLLIIIRMFQNPSEALLLLQSLYDK